jgi:peptidoglycan L-alanyl-D-glutamate endopeptidase CwlK
MPHFGFRSSELLATCHPEIGAICRAVIPEQDFTIICGLREEKAQAEAFVTGHSSVEWPDSKHNVVPPEELSDAVDVAPWFMVRPHIRWDHEREFILLAGRILQAAAALSIRLRWGGDWDQDQNLYDRNVPFDLGHFERIGD